MQLSIFGSVVYVQFLSTDFTYSPKALDLYKTPKDYFSLQKYLIPSFSYVLL